MAGSNIRVVYLQPAPLFGGAERQAAEQASFLPALGVELTVIGGPGQAIADWMRSAPRARFVHSRHFPGWPPQRGLRALTLPWRYLVCGLRARAEFARIAARAHPDVIVASLPFTWMVGTIVARARGIPIIWRAGGSRISVPQKIGLWLIARLVRPDLLLCNGRSVRRLFHPLIPAPVAVLPNGINTAVFGTNRGDAARYRPANAALVVGFAGRLARSKHIEDIIALAARARLRHPDLWVLVAGEGSERAEYERRARDAGAGNLRFLGFVADMPSFYAACDIVVLPSDSEGCSNVLLEAMCSGKVVVASDIGPTRELVRDGETGLVYPLGDAPALTRAIERLIVRPELRKRLARNAALGVQASTALRSAEGLARILRDVVTRWKTDAQPLRRALQSKVA